MTLTKLTRKLQLMGRLTSCCVVIALVGICLAASDGVTAQTNRLLPDSTEGGFCGTARYEEVEGYQFAPREFLGTHQFKVGADYVHSDLDGIEIFRLVELVGVNGNVIERIGFSSPASFSAHQNEAAFYISDQWAVSSRMSFDLGFRADGDSITHSAHLAPRAGVLLSLTGDGKTLLKGGAGIFYDRVPLMFAPFAEFPGRTVTLIGPGGQASSSTAFVNRVTSTSISLASRSPVSSLTTNSIAL